MISPAQHEVLGFVMSEEGKIDSRALPIKWFIPEMTQIIAQILLTLSLDLLFSICIPMFLLGFVARD